MGVSINVCINSLMLSLLLICLNQCPAVLHVTMFCLLNVKPQNYHRAATNIIGHGTNIKWKREEKEGLDCLVVCFKRFTKLISLEQTYNLVTCE